MRRMDLAPSLSSCSTLPLRSFESRLCCHGLKRAQRLAYTQQGAKVPVTFATLSANGPSGGFFEESRVIPW